MLFKDDQIWSYAGQRTGWTKEILLDYLSGDNYKDLSVVYEEDMTSFIEKQLGLGGGSGIMLRKYYDKFSAFCESKSKALG